MKSTYFGDRPGTKKKLSKSDIRARYRSITMKGLSRRGTGDTFLSRERKSGRGRWLELNDLKPTIGGPPEAGFGLYTNNEPTPKHKHPCPPKDPATALKMAAQVGPALPLKLQVAIAGALGYGNAPQVIASIGSDIWAVRGSIGVIMFEFGLAATILLIGAPHAPVILVGVAIGVTVIGVALVLSEIFDIFGSAEEAVKPARRGAEEWHKRTQETFKKAEEAMGTTQPAEE